ncbi:MAG: hypothetical protein HW380_1118 [Magnetococcales bacterium]|nr:hypothetical protein [Magnetococcales bacterium]
MAQKRRKKGYSSPPRPKSSEGLDHLRSGHFKKAIESLKLALKEDPQSADLKNLLAEAYVGRARELSDKGMGQEAAIMLERSSLLTEKPPDPVMLFSLFLKGGQIDRAVASLKPQKEKSETGESLDAGPLGEALAGLSLVGCAEVLTLFDENSPFVNHHHTALEILQSYDRGEDDAALVLLKKLPVGSPFKNFRLFIHALILSASQPETALGLLAKVGEDSFFHPLAQAVKLATASDPSQIDALSSLSSPASDLARRLLNIDADALRTVSQLESLASNPDKLAKALLKPGLEPLFPREVLKALCLPLLPSAIGQLEPFQQRFGHLPPWEVQRIRALAMEEQNRWSSAVAEWKKAADNVNDPMIKALIYQRLAGFPHFQDSRNLWEMFQSGGREKNSRADFLESSLRYDPKDRDTHLALIHLHGKKKNNPKVRTTLDRAVREFPEDREILEAAMDATFAAGTFKKAGTFAEKILSFNPIHHRAHSVMVESHLAHARKKIKERRLDLANKELLVAESLEKKHARSGRVQVCQAMVAFLNGQGPEGEEKLRLARSLPTHPLETELMIQAEAARLKVPSDIVKKNELTFKALSKNAVPDTSSILKLIQNIEHYLEEKSLPVKHWMEILQPLFIKAAVLTFTMEERRLICNILLENNFFNILNHFAKAGQKQWAEEGSFIFFSLSAQSEGNVLAVRDGRIGILEEAMHSTDSRLDTRTMGNMEKFLSASFLTPRRPVFFDDDDDDDDDDVDFSCMDDTDFESELGPIVALLKGEIESRVVREHKLRRKMGDKKYGESLAKELAQGLPMGKEIFGEIIRKILENNPLPDHGTKKQSEKSDAGHRSPRQLEIEFDD